MFSMTGGSNKLNYTKCLNSLEELLHAKVRTTSFPLRSAGVRNVVY
jgi:hypothetical protein